MLTFNSVHYYHHVSGIVRRLNVSNIFHGRYNHVVLTSKPSQLRCKSTFFGNQSVNDCFKICQLPSIFLSNNLFGLKTSASLVTLNIHVTKFTRSLFCSCKTIYCDASNKFTTLERQHLIIKNPLASNQRSGKYLHTTVDQLITTRNQLTAAENQRNTLNQCSKTTDQLSAAKNQSFTAKDQNTMADNGHHSRECRHEKYLLSTHRGVGVSEEDVQMMNDARNIFDQAVASVLPHHLIKNKLKLSQNDTILTVDDTEYILQKNVCVIGFGKAVMGMARTLEDCIGKHIVKGIISVPKGIQEMFKNEGKQDMLLEPGSRIVVMEGAAGNLPDAKSLKAAMEIMKITEDVKEGDILIVLISGGGSALLPSPRPPVTLEDMLSLTRLMSKSGASIIQMNTVRKRIESLKGGGLAKLARPAKVIALILSDVIGDPLDFIAGGPTVQDTCAPEDSLNVLKELHISTAIPASVSELLSEECSNNPDPEGDTLDWSHVQNVLVGSNRSACDAACVRSDSLGYFPYLLSTQVEGEAQDLGRTYINLAKYISLGLQASGQEEDPSDLEQLLMRKFNIDLDKLRQLPVLFKKAVTSGKKGVCVVAGGETTVIVTGKGIGGRNQEMAVSAALELDSQLLKLCEVAEKTSAQTKVVFLAAGTDGIDGPNPAAGGVISAGFLADAAASGLDVVDFLRRNDTYTLLSKVDHGLNHVITGHTGTNVMDIHVLLITKMS